MTKKCLTKSLLKWDFRIIKLNTINEYKKAIKHFLKFMGNYELATKIKRREPKDNELTRDDLLTVDEVQQLSKHSGHIPGSRHLRRYAKLVDADADRKILIELGLISEDEAEPEVKKLTPVKCSICGEFNEPNRVRCWRCKAALDPTKLVQEFGEEEIIEAIMDNNLQRIVKERLKKVIKEILIGERAKSPLIFSVAYLI